MVADPPAPLGKRYPSGMPGWISPWEIAILLVIILLLFGPKRLPELGRSLGRGMREFKDSVKGGVHDDDDTPELPRASEEEPVSPREHESGTVR
jgi:sec-independent protein translocase protein TatA